MRGPLMRGAPSETRAPRPAGGRRSCPARGAVRVPCRHRPARCAAEPPAGADHRSGWPPHGRGPTLPDMRPAAPRSGLRNPRHLRTIRPVSGSCATTRPRSSLRPRASVRANPQLVPGRGEPELRAGSSGLPAGRLRRHRRCAAAAGQPRRDGAYAFAAVTAVLWMIVPVPGLAPAARAARIPSRRGFAPAPHMTQRLRRDEPVPLPQRPNIRPAPHRLRHVGRDRPGRGPLERTGRTAGVFPPWEVTWGPIRVGPKRAPTPREVRTSARPARASARRGIPVAI